MPSTPAVTIISKFAFQTNRLLDRVSETLQSATKAIEGQLINGKPQALTAFKSPIHTIQLTDVSQIDQWIHDFNAGITAITENPDNTDLKTQEPTNLVDQLKKNRATTPTKINRD